MKKYLSLISLLVLSLVSCTNEIENIFTGGEVTTINVSAEEFQTETRTSIDNTNYSVKWNAGDMIGIFPMKENAKQIAFEISGGSGSSNASFDGNGWGLKNGTSYVAYYPLNRDALLDKTSITLDYTGQTQNGNGNSSHLGGYDFLKAASTQAVNGSLDLQFEHIGTLIHLTLDVPNGTYKKVELHTDGTFYSKAVLNLETGNTLPDEESETKTLTLNLNNVSVTDGKLEILTMIYPVDLEESYIYAYAFDEEGNNVSTTTWKGVTFQPSTVWNGGELKVIPYLTFTAEAEQTLTMTQAVETLEYSVNNGAWQTLGTNTVTFGGSNSDLRIRGKNSNGTRGARFCFGNDAEVFCTGDIRTLVDYEQYKDTDTSQARFGDLFANNPQLVSAPMLPAKNLALGCYAGMFSFCTGLKIAPELPATEVPAWGYQVMFCGCESLKQAPELPATTIGDYSYSGMFEGCINLEKAPVISAEVLADHCCDLMFRYCSSLTTLPKELPATTLAPYCYFQMFAGCTSLTTAPELMATNLADCCCEMMFYMCANLTTAPKLLATTLAPYCYFQMFYGTGIKEIPAHLQNTELVKSWINRNVGLMGLFAGLPVTDEYLSKILPVNSAGRYYMPATTLTDHCYSNMFEGCTSLTTAPELPATTLAKGCYFSMFNGCTSLSTAPELPATTLADDCYDGMFRFCTNLSTAPDLPATTLTSYCYRYMFYGCTNLKAAPELPATTLADHCYDGMFSNCSKLNYIKMMATDISASECIAGWTWNVSSSGTFVKNAAATWNNYYTDNYGNRVIPTGWTIQTATE